MSAAPRRTLEPEAFVSRRRPYVAIYEHWERNQWSPLAIDFGTDAASFAELGDEGRAALMWICAQRFHAEFNVATLLAPFLLAAPAYEMQLVLATQVADEYRHVQAVVRVYEEVFGLTGGLEEVRELADGHMDEVAGTLYQALDDMVRPLAASQDADTFLRAVFAYHVMGEGVVGQTTQRLLPAQLARLGDFPGLVRASRLASRDEARHVAFGVTCVRDRVAEDREQARAVVGYIAEGFRALCTQLLEATDTSLGERFVGAYGVEPERLWHDAMHQLERRLRSIGLADD